MGFLRGRTMKYVVSMFCLSAIIAWADGHGPAFGYGTTVLGAGDGSVEMALTWRSGVAMLGPAASYGVTENLQVSVSAPFHLDHGEHPVGRFTASMPGNPEVEGLVAWRFLHRQTGIGTRFESTLYLGSSVSTQLPPRSDGPPLRRAPGIFAGGAASHISRRYYVWAGGGYERYFSLDQKDHQSNSLLTSVAFGWRPPFWNADYPKPDLRFLWESTGELVGYAWRSAPAPPGSAHSHDLVEGASLPIRDPTNPLPTPGGNIILPNSGGSAVYSGPSMLLTFRSLAFQSGVLFAIWRDPNGIQPADKRRIVVGLTYYFLKGRK